MSGGSLEPRCVFLLCYSDVHFMLFGLCFLKQHDKTFIIDLQMICS